MYQNNQIEKINKKGKLLIYCTLIFLFMLNFNINIVKAKNINILIDSFQLDYKGNQVKVTCNGFTVSDKETPAIIVDNNLLASYDDIVSYSPYGISVKYDSATKYYNFTRGDKKVQLKLNSNSIIVNGKEKTMSTSPKKVTYITAGSTKILVPIKDLCEELGLEYNYDKTNDIAQISDDLEIYYNKKWRNYTNIQAGVVTLDSKVKLGYVPAIFINNTSLVPVKKVFSTSKIKAEYNYNSKENMVTLKANGTEIVFYIDDNSASVNGVDYILPIGAIKVKDKTYKSSRVMVPAAFTAQMLGYTYNFNSAENIINITKDEKNIEDIYDLSVLSDNNEIYDEFVNLPLEDNQITNDIVETVSITAIKKVSNSPAKESFEITSLTPFGNIDWSNEDEQLSINIENSYFGNAVYTYDNCNVDRLNILYDDDKNITQLNFSINSTKAKFNISLSDDKKTLIVDIYLNYITNIKYSRTKDIDSITITSIDDIDFNIEEDNMAFYITFPCVFNLVGEKDYTLDNEENIIGFSIIENGIDTKLTIKKSKISSYYITSEDNVITISCTGNVIDDEYSEVNDTSLNIDTDVNNDNNIIINNDNIDDNINISDNNHNILDGVNSTTTNINTITDNTTDFGIKIPKDSSMIFSDIMTEDFYTVSGSYKFQIKIKGDYVSYLQNKSLTINSPYVSSTYISSSNGYTIINVITSKLQGFKLYDKKNYIGVKMGNPRDIYDAIVILDAGHGGSDNGATYYSVREKDITYSIMYTYAKQYFNSVNSPVKAYFTRNSDTLPSLYERAGFAQKVGADAFISLHMNAATNKSASGTEVYYSSANNSTAFSGLNSSLLAQKYLSAITSNLDTTNRGVKTAKFVVVNSNTVPAILIELGFLSNANECSKFNTSSLQKETAKVIYNTTCSLFMNYPTGR